MIRIYEYQRKLLFLENANSPLGAPVGVIIQVDESEWAFFPDRHRGFSLADLQEISNKVQTLNATPLHVQRANTESDESSDL